MPIASYKYAYISLKTRRKQKLINLMRFTNILMIIFHTLFFWIYALFICIELIYYEIMTHLWFCTLSLKERFQNEFFQKSFKIDFFLWIFTKSFDISNVHAILVLYMWVALVEMTAAT